MIPWAFLDLMTTEAQERLITENAKLTPAQKQSELARVRAMRQAPGGP